MDSSEALRYVGFIDRVDSKFIHGWAYDTEDIQSVVVVEAITSAGKTSSALANIYRKDVSDAGHGTGKYGFVIALESLSLKEESVMVRFARSKHPISMEPIKFEALPALLTHYLPTAYNDGMISIEAQIRQSHDILCGSISSLPKIERSIINDVLIETANPVLDTDGLITKFILYEYLRSHRELNADEVSSDLTYRMKILFWYLNNFRRDDCVAIFPPLSASQISFLNSPAPILGASAEVSIALYNFLLIERPDLSALTERSTLQEAVYWWCIEKTPAKGLDSLVTAAQIAFLASYQTSAEEPFSLNVFVSRFSRHHHVLSALDMSIGRDRAAAYHYLFLYSFVNPYIRKYLPHRVLILLSEEKNGLPSSLDSVIAHYCFTGGLRDNLNEARHLRRMGDTLLEGAGCLARVSISSNGYANYSASFEGVEEGVAVIGPLKAASGLGQAIRLSVEIIIQAERISPTIYDFDLDNPSPKVFSRPDGYKPYVNPRAINLIHLNAEALPLLFAYAPHAVTARSYNIGYFFWELDMIPETHQLALELVDEIWVASEYVRAIYAKYTHKPVINVGMAAAALRNFSAAQQCLVKFDLKNFVFLATFDSFSFIERKNPLAIIAAFGAAFPLGTESAKLILKTQNRLRVEDPHQRILWRRIDAAIEADHRIQLIDETYAYASLLALKRGCDCYVSLHRSEGWGFGIIEAMQLGLPVITTAYSGNMDFCTPDTTFLVEYELVGVHKTEYQAVAPGSHWAAPSISAAAQAMIRVMTDSAEVSKKCAAAKLLVQTRFSVSAIAKRYAERLDAIRSSGILDRIVT